MGRGESRYSGKSSPHWYDTDSFLELFRAAGNLTVREVVEEFDGCSGGKAGQIAADFKNKPAKHLTRDEAEQLLTEAKKSARPVKPERLGNLGPEIDGLPKSYAKLTGTIVRRAARGEQNAEIPFVLEAYAEVADKAECHISVNRSPITGIVKARHSADELSIFGCGLGHSFKIGRRPMRIFLNIETPYMPITSDGKAPDLVPFVEQIYEVLSKVSKRAKKGVTGCPEDKTPSMSDVIRQVLEKSIDKASGSGAYRYSLRQLYYVVRAYVSEILEVDLQYDNFNKVITAYESEHGDPPGVYRDPRGIIYHPHTREEIPLGTLQVEKYQRPAYVFRRLLYSEKEGVVHILKAAGWPERHDCPS